MSEEYIVSDKINRPATLEDVMVVIKLLNKYQVPYLLIGGYALMLQGNQRTTKDIDIVLPVGLDVGRKIKEAFQNLPDKASEKMQDDWFEEDETSR